MAIPPVGPLGAAPLPGDPSRRSPGREEAKRRRGPRPPRGSAQAPLLADEVTLSADARRKLVEDVEDKDGR